MTLFRNLILALSALTLASCGGSNAVVDGDMVHLAKGASAVDTPSAGLAEFEISRPYTDDITTSSVSARKPVAGFWEDFQISCCSHVPAF